MEKWTCKLLKNYGMQYESDNSTEDQDNICWQKNLVTFQSRSFFGNLTPTGLVE